jgi:hypothetical protein
MGWQFRKSIKVGPLRFTLGKRGMSASAWLGPLRYTARPDGELCPHLADFRRRRLDHESDPAGARDHQ